MDWTIREATPDDAEALIAHVQRLVEEPQIDIPLAPGEFTYTVDQERDLLREYAASENSVFLYLALKRTGVPAELHIYAGAAHDFGVRPNDQPCSTWTQSCAHWLRHQGLLKPL